MLSEFRDIHVPYVQIEGLKRDYVTLKSARILIEQFRVWFYQQSMSKIAVIFRLILAMCSVTIAGSFYKDIYKYSVAAKNLFHRLNLRNDLRK